LETSGSTDVQGQAINESYSDGVQDQMEESVYIKTTVAGAKAFKRLVKAGSRVSKRIETTPFFKSTEVDITVEVTMENGKKKLTGLRWYGGKFSHLRWLSPLLPKAFLFCEPFGGSAAVLLNREPSPVEVYNDIDSDLVTFLKVLREEPDELIEKLYLTPFSREEFANACKHKYDRQLPDLERARLFFIRAEQVRIGLAQTATPGRWAWCKFTSRRGMAGAVSRWIGRIEGLCAITDRLRNVQIENMEAIDVIKRYDSKDTLFYCDPPYPHESRGDIHAYEFEMNEEQHMKLSEVLHDVKGKVALSSYKSPLMTKLYHDWIRIDAPMMIAHSIKQMRQESLWINYNPLILGVDAIRKLKLMGCSFGPDTSESLR